MINNHYEAKQGKQRCDTLASMAYQLSLCLVQNFWPNVKTLWAASWASRWHPHWRKSSKLGEPPGNFKLGRSWSCAFSEPLGTNSSLQPRSSANDTNAWAIVQSSVQGAPLQLTGCTLSKEAVLLGVDDARWPYGPKPLSSRSSSKATAHWLRSHRRGSNAHYSQLTDRAIAP